MPALPPLAAASTPAFIANVVGLAVAHAAKRGLSGAIIDVARTHGLAVGTVQEWVSRARGVETVPVPPGLLVCGMCAQPMILIRMLTDEQVYLCAPACDRTPVAAEEIRDVIADRVWHHTPYLVPTGTAHRAADYAPGAMHRVTVGATGVRELDITWRAHPLKVLWPRWSMTQRLCQARQDARRGRHELALAVLRSGLLLVDPACDAVALDVPTAQTAVLLARLTIAAGDPVAALPWATWGHRCLRRILCGSTALQTRAALAVLAAAHRDAGDLTAATHAYSDLVRHHTQAEGPTAVSTLAAQTDLAVVLYEAGHCDQAQQLLFRTITTHRSVHRDHPAEARMADALARMRAACASHDHGAPAPRAVPTSRLQPSTITCLECGNPYAALATHLSRTHKISVAEYRRRHNLPRTPLTSLATRRMHLTAKRLRDSYEPWTARRISELRRALGVSQQGFAILCGVTSHTVRNWEKGRATPRSRARQLLHQLDTTQETPPAFAQTPQVHPDRDPPAQPPVE